MLSINESLNINSFIRTWAMFVYTCALYAGLISFHHSPVLEFLKFVIILNSKLNEWQNNFHQRFLIWCLGGARSMSFFQQKIFSKKKQKSSAMSFSSLREGLVPKETNNFGRIMKGKALFSHFSLSDFTQGYFCSG